MKKLILVLVVVVFFCGFKLANASDVIISEFVSDSNSGEQEWVEILNTTGNPIELIGWKLTELTSPSTNPVEKDLLSLSGTLPAGEVLAFDVGSTKLNNGGDSIGLYNGSNETDRVTFGTVKDYSQDLSAPSKGKSGAFISGSWESNQDPTKGESNPNSGSSDENNDEEDTTDDEDSSSDSESETATETKATATPTLKTKILTKTLAFVGQPTEFSLDVKYGSSTYTTGKYFWNFGDGDSREVINQPGGIYHTYFYSGEYVVSSEYYKSYLSQVPDVVNKITIKAVPLTVSISKVGDAKDFFIELTNNSGYEIDISKWLINANGKIFVLPKNSIILPKKQTTISGKITGFVLGDEKILKLISSAGDTVFDYNPPIIQTEIIAEAPILAPISAPAKVSVANAENNNPIENAILLENQIPVPDENLFENLPASPVLSEQNTENSNSYFLWIGLFFFLGVGASAVYFVRRGRNSRTGTQVGSNAGDDFSILDE